MTYRLEFMMPSMDLSPILRQTVKTHFSLNGELSHGSCHEGSSRKSSSWPPSGGWNRGSRSAKWRGLGGEPQRAAPLAAGVPPGVRARLSGQRQAALVDEGQIAELERKVGQQALEIDFLKGCLQHIEEQRMLQALTGNPRRLPEGRRRSEGRPRIDAWSGCASWAGQPGRLLPLAKTPLPSGGSRHGSARRDPADRAGVAQLRPAADHG